MWDRRACDARVRMQARRLVHLSTHDVFNSSTIPSSSSIPFFAALLPLCACTSSPAVLALVPAPSSSPSPHRAYLHPLTRGRPRQGPCCQPIRPSVANIAPSTPRFRHYISSLASAPCLERSISSASTRPTLWITCGGSRLVLFPCVSRVAPYSPASNRGLPCAAPPLPASVRRFEHESPWKSGTSTRGSATSFRGDPYAPSDPCDWAPTSLCIPGFLCV